MNDSTQISTSASRALAPPKVMEALSNLRMPKDQAFGRSVLPVIAVATYEDDAWSNLEIKLDYEHPISAGSTVVQYAQSVFEGMKAYFVDQSVPQVFRARDHAARFRASAERMCMPPVPEELFLEAVTCIASIYQGFIPKEHQGALYLRPAMFGTDFSLSIVPSTHYSFTVHAAPAEPFMRDMMSVLIERKHSRAAVGGTGGVKAAGNYASSFRSLRAAQSQGCATSLWLDPVENRFVEELSMMNVFFVRDGALLTPKLSNSFLAGLTRNSLITLARHAGVRVVEDRIDIESVISDIKNGHITEAFSSGTAAVVAPIRSFKEADGREYIVSERPGIITSSLKGMLLDIQEGRREDIYHWMVDAH